MDEGAGSPASKRGKALIVPDRDLLECLGAGTPGKQLVEPYSRSPRLFDHHDWRGRAEACRQEGRGARGMPPESAPGTVDIAGHGNEKDKSTPLAPSILVLICCGCCIPHTVWVITDSRPLPDQQVAILVGSQTTTHSSHFRTPLHVATAKMYIDTWFLACHPTLPLLLPLTLNRAPPFLTNAPSIMQN